MMAVTSANSMVYRFLYLGDEGSFPLDRQTLEGEKLDFDFETAEDGRRYVAESRDNGRSIDAVVIDGASAPHSHTLARRLREADPVVPLVFLVEPEAVERFRRNLMLTPSMRDCVVASVEISRQDLIRKLKEIARSARHAWRVRSAIRHINREIGTWTGVRPEVRERLVASDRYLMALMANAPDAFIVTDRDGAVVAWNNGATSLYGLSKDQVHEQHVTMLFADRERDRLRDALDRAYHGEVVRTEPFICNRANGVRWHAEVTVSPVVDEKGRPFGISIISRDVSDRIMAERARVAAFDREQRAREETEHANAQLQFLAEAGTILSSSLDYETTLRRVAEVAVPHIADWAVVDMLDEEGRVNRLALSHRNPEKIALVRELGERYRTSEREDSPVRRVLATGEPFFFREVTDEMLVAAAADEEHLDALRRLDPRSVMLAPITARGEHIGVFSLATAESNRLLTDSDFELVGELARRASIAVEQALLFRETQRFNEELERRVEERTAQLKAANRELKMFSFSVSHDLRSPLRAIEGFTRILLEEHAADLDAEAQRLLNIVRKNTLRMDALISDLLDFSSMSRARISPEEVDMTELVQEVFHDVAAESPERLENISISVAGLPPAWADWSLMRQVLENLISNAIKFSHPVEKPIIEVGVDTTDGEVTYFVRDNGVGFNMAYAEKLFQVFQRLHSPREFEGTGIGLAIVHRIITAHGGKVWADSAEGAGTTIFFRLPPRPRS